MVEAYDAKKELLIALRKKKELVEYEKKYFKSKGFKPYPYQEKFYEAGSRFKQRLLCAGNRVEYLAP